MLQLEGNKSALYQWDLNQRLVLTDVDSAIEVHYSKPGYECLVTETYEENGIMYSNIPNIMLQSKGIISVYVYTEEEDKSYTKHNAEILVLFREKPSDYVYTETETQTFESLEKRVERLEKGGGGQGTFFTPDETLSLKEGVLSVNVTHEVKSGNMLPISSAAVATTVGNIEVLLKTI